MSTPPKESTYAIVKGAHGKLLYIAESVMRDKNLKRFVKGEILTKGLTKDEAVAFLKLTGANK